ncbi:uncharacterized protein LOC144657311 [Oculina patagonica]
MKIESIKLDMKLVFEFTEDRGSANVNSTPNDNRTSKHGKIHRFKESTEYPQNTTCRVHETFQLGSPSLLTRVWDFTVATAKQTWTKCYEITVATFNGIWNGIIWMTESTCQKVTWMANKAWNGVRWLVGKVCKGFAWMADKAWNGLTWIVERICKGVSWMVDWISHALIWMSEKIWNGLAWIGKLFLPGNYVTDALNKFYYGYLDKHVKHVQALIAASTWKDFFYMMSSVVVVNVALLVIYLLVKCTVNFIRRLWQARKDRIAAANLPPATKKPIWRPKPKKKHKNKNKNKW